MKVRLLLLGLLFAIMTTIFTIALVYKINWILSPEPYLNSPSIGTILLSLSLLASDAFLPTPSSIVMMASGFHFGPFWGSILSAVGLMLGNATGFLFARYSNEWLTKKFPEEARQKRRTFWNRWGDFALTLSRPIPVLAESILFISATTPMPFWRAMSYCFLGVIPTALVFNLVGYYAFQLSWFLPILGIIALSLPVLLLTQWLLNLFYK